MIATLALWAQFAIVAHAPESVQACDVVEVSVAISAPMGTTPQLATPVFAPFDLLRTGASQQTEAGRRVFEYRFTLATSRVGDFTIPSFAASLPGQIIRTPPQRVSVRASRIRPAPVVLARARIDTALEVNLAALTVAETVYVGQQATYEVAVFLNQTARERLRRNPTFYPPEMQAMLAYDLPPAAPSERRRGSQCFDALVYRRALFPLIPGRLVIPPAQLVYSIGLSSTSLFSREESRELQTDSVSIVALDPPLNGRPAEFGGAVGLVRVDAQLDSIASRVGDPVLFTVRVSGTGNVKLFPRPALAMPWASVVSADERVRVDSTGTRIGGAKEFDWVLTPRLAGEFDVPPVRVGYFDPAREQYDVAQTPPRRLRVAAGSLASADTGRIESTLPIRMGFRGESSPPLHTRPAFWLLLVMAPIPAVVSRVRRRARPARARVDDPLRALRIAAAAQNVDAAALRRQFVRVLAHRLGCSPEDFTRTGALDRALRRAGVSQTTSERADALLRQLDAAAYAGSSIAPGAARSADVVARAVDAEALARTELPFWIPILVVAALTGLAARAMAVDPADAHFAHGVSAYVRDDFVESRDAFAAAASLEPRAPDAWANYGSAAWAASDTADAVFGWRQALAIEPDAPDMQERIGLAHDFGMEGPGWVPSVPRDAAAWLVLALWLSAWTLAWIARKPHAWATRWPMPLAVCAMLVGLATIELQQRVSGAALAVVRHATSVASAPAIGLDRGPTIGNGELVRILGRRGVWTRIESTAGREGWIASGELLAIAVRRPPRN